jgi:hypothetical protein
MKLTAKTYRYIDEEEAANQTDNDSKKKGGKK